MSFELCLPHLTKIFFSLFSSFYVPYFSSSVDRKTKIVRNIKIIIIYFSVTDWGPPPWIKCIELIKYLRSSEWFCAFPDLWPYSSEWLWLRINLQVSEVFMYRIKHQQYIFPCYTSMKTLSLLACQLLSGWNWARTQSYSTALHPFQSLVLMLVAYHFVNTVRNMT